MRGWVSANKQDTHEVYVRGLFNYDDWNSNTNPLGRGDESDEALERAWYGLNVNRFLGWDVDGPVALNFKAGRAFQTIGSSFTMAIPLDMIYLRADVYDWQVTSFVGKTILDSTNIDRSALLTRQDRVLWGTEFAYEKFSDHRPYAYYLSNSDHTDPTVVSAQGYEYDSRYVGIGSRGILGSDDLRYGVELVREWGRSYPSGTAAERENIRAYAFDLLLEYYFHHATRPKLMFEYMFGSGDPDRVPGTSSVATSGGNTAGSNDRAFNAFGYRDTGIALSPAISNLHIYSGGASLFPFIDSLQFKELEAGGKVFFYSKHRDGGAISDTSATNGAGWVGCEWDLFCNWRITSDVAGTLRYGMFHPGSAYDGGDKSPRDFLYSGLVVSF